MADAVQGVRSGKSLTELLARCPAELRPATQALSFQVLRLLGGAEAVRSVLAPKTPPPKVDSLLLSALALLWPMDAPPYADHTVVDQAVSAATQRVPNAAKFVNAVLRRFLRERDGLVANAQRDPQAAFNHPAWWIDRLKHDWPTHWQAVLHANNEHPPMTLRIKGSAEAYVERLAAAGVESGVVSVLAVDGTLRGPAGSIDQLSASRLEALPSVFDLDLSGGAFPQGSPPSIAGFNDADAGTQGGTDVGRAMLSDGAALTLGVDVGGDVTLRSVSGRERTLRVVGTYRRTAFVGPAVVERSDAEAIAADGSFEVAAIDVPARFDVADAAGYFGRNLRGFPKLRVHTPEFAALNVGVADTVTRLALVVLSGALLVGALGAANTISLSVMERRRELGLLRAVGATAGQVRSLVRTEALVICGLAGLVAVCAGVGVAVIAVGRAPAEFAVVPWLSLGVVGVAALTIGAASAALATRRQNAGGPLDAL